jgi:hypothetical protein
VEPDLALNDKKLIFHRGGKDGPIIGTASPCSEKHHQTDIHFVSPNLIVPLKHKHRSQFNHKGKGYFWNGECYKGGSELIEEDSGASVAKFEPSVFEGNNHSIPAGNLKISWHDAQDIVVMTAIVMQVRAEEMMGPVRSLHSRSLILAYQSFAQGE